MGTIISRPVLHNIELALLSIAQVVDTLVRTFEHLLSALISKCISPSIYRHFYVSAPTNVDATLDMTELEREGLTRICTEEGVCYIPATRLEQHRAWRKRKQEDRLKRRKMRAEWAAQGLNVDQMAREERRKEREKRKKDQNGAGKEMESMLGNEVEERKEELSRTSTAVGDEPKPKHVKKEKPLYVMGNISKQSMTSVESNSNDTQEGHWAHKHRTRPLTAVREASHDHGAHFTSGLTQPLVNDFAKHSKEVEPRRNHKRLNSAPSPMMMVNEKSQPSVQAISASRIASNFPQKEQESGNFFSIKKLQRAGHQPSSSMPPPVTSTSVLRAAHQNNNAMINPFPSPPALVQPKPRRPISSSNFEIVSSPGIVMAGPHGPHRTAATPPPAFLNRNRNSIDLSNPVSRNGTPTIHSDNDASSIRSKRSVTSSTPPPYVIHLADKACKSRWESTAKERKGWKGEVKRLAINKVNEQRTANRSSVNLTK